MHLHCGSQSQSVMCLWFLEGLGQHFFPTKWFPPIWNLKCDWFHSQLTISVMLNFPSNSLRPNQIGSFGPCWIFQEFVFQTITIRVVYHSCSVNKHVILLKESENIFPLRIPWKPRGFPTSIHYMHKLLHHNEWLLNISRGLISHALVWNISTIFFRTLGYMFP